jgi:AcrR family transcriptional regulator
MSVRERREREERARLSSILTAAETVFSKNGYYQTRMDDIADAAELAKGTLYYHFKNKDAIYLRLLERESTNILKEVKDRISERVSFLQTLREILYFYLEYFERNPNFLRMFFPCMCGFIHFENAALVRRSTNKYVRHVDFIRLALEKKIRQEKVPVRFEELLKFLSTLYIGIGMKLLEGKKSEATAAVDFFLGLMQKVMEEKR